jgi:hypothetical protein
MFNQAFRKSLATRAPGPEERQPRGAQPARALRNIGPGGQEYKLVETGQADRFVLPSSRIRRTNTPLETNLFFLTNGGSLAACSGGEAYRSPLMTKTDSKP